MARAAAATNANFGYSRCSPSHSGVDRARQVRCVLDVEGLARAFIVVPPHAELNNSRRSAGRGHASAMCLESSGVLFEPCEAARRL